MSLLQIFKAAKTISSRHGPSWNQQHGEGLSKAPGLNFINILCPAFTHTDPKSAKNTVKPSVFFTLLRSACVRDVHKMLVKWTPDRIDESPSQLAKRSSLAVNQRVSTVCVRNLDKHNFLCETF